MARILEVVLLILIILLSLVAGFFYSASLSPFADTLAYSKSFNTSFFEQEQCQALAPARIGYTLNFTPFVSQKLKHFYNETGNLEYSVCLVGTLRNSTITVTDTDNFILGSENSTNMSNCKSLQYVGNLHKHPKHTPTPSLTDAYAYYERYTFYNNLISVIQHDYNKLSVMTEEKWYGGEQIEI